MKSSHFIFSATIAIFSRGEERRGVLVCCLWLANGCWEVSVVIVRWRAGDWHIESLQVLTATNTAGGREEGTVILLECGPTLDWWTSSSLSSARPWWPWWTLSLSVSPSPQAELDWPVVTLLLEGRSLSWVWPTSWSPPEHQHFGCSWVHLHQSGERCDLSQVSLTWQNW